MRTGKSLSGIRRDVPKRRASVDSAAALMVWRFPVSPEAFGAACLTFKHVRTGRIAQHGTSAN
jgi:hypothetical protein